MKKENDAGGKYISYGCSLMLMAGLIGEIVYAAVTILT